MNIKTADLAWIGLAMLHKDHPEKPGFRAAEVVHAVKLHGVAAKVPPGLHAHLYQHSVANTAPSSGRYRMLYRLPDGTLRLFRSGDDYHPDRSGKTKPQRSEIPPKYWPLVDWYEREYCAGSNVRPEDDPILQLWGLGKELWAGEDADAYVRRERDGFETEADRLEAGVQRTRWPKRRAG